MARFVTIHSVPFTPQELAAEHARAMRIVRAVLDACDARRATARAARNAGMTAHDGRWVLSIGKAAIGMAEGLADACGLPDRHLIITVDGPKQDRLTNILRSDHPLPTQRSLDAGQAVKRFIEEAKTAGAPSLTALISGGASSLICEPIPGIDLDEYRAVVQAMLQAGWSIQWTNTVRRAIDQLKDGALANLAAPLPIDLLVVSDVVGDTIFDIGSGPFTKGPTSYARAEALCLDITLRPRSEPAAKAVLQRPAPPKAWPCRREIVVASNAIAAAAAKSTLESEGFQIDNFLVDVAERAHKVAYNAETAIDKLNSQQGLCWSGEWPASVRVSGFGGRAQACIVQLRDYCKSFRDDTDRRCIALAFATDGVDGVPPPGEPSAAGAWCWSGMSWDPDPLHEAAPACPVLVQAIQKAGGDFDYADLHVWREANSYHVLAHRDKHRRPGEPPAHIFTGPTGTNVNDLLIAWRVK